MRRAVVPTIPQRMAGRRPWQAGDDDGHHREPQSAKDMTGREGDKREQQEQPDESTDIAVAGEEAADDRDGQPIRTATINARPAANGLAPETTSMYRTSRQAAPAG